MPTSCSESDDLEGGKIGLSEYVDFKVFPPWQNLDQVGSVIHKNLVFCAQLFVHDGGKTCWNINLERVV